MVNMVNTPASSILYSACYSEGAGRVILCLIQRFRNFWPYFCHVSFTYLERAGGSSIIKSLESSSMRLLKAMKSENPDVISIKKLMYKRNTLRASCAKQLNDSVPQHILVSHAFFISDLMHQVNNEKFLEPLTYRFAKASQIVV